LSIDETNDNLSLIKRETGEELDLTEYKMSDTNNVTEAELLNFTQEMSHLRLTPNPSPGSTPKPPANRLRTSPSKLLHKLLPC
jgi:hypothetical protein